jgi:hypothetical protein
MITKYDMRLSEIAVSSWKREGVRGWERYGEEHSIRNGIR